MFEFAVSLLAPCILSEPEAGPMTPSTPVVGRSLFDPATTVDPGCDPIRSIRFGAAEVGGPHYYRVQGASLLAEYDNTQNDANHIHAVWRDRVDDFGADLLRRHYRQSH